MENEIIKVDTIPSIIKDDTRKKFFAKTSSIYKALKNSFKIENNKLLYALNQIPIISHALKYEKGFTAIIPEEFKQGLKDGTFKIMQGKDSSIISTIVDKNRHVVHQIRLEEFTEFVHHVELSRVMNQICMQMQLDEIQKNLSEFRIEVNSKLNEILKNLHDNRIISADSLKLSFERYQKGEEITKSQLLLKVDDAKANLFKEIESQINKLWDYKKNQKSINEDTNKDIQSKIAFILEAIQSVQDVFFIEYFLSRDNENKCYEITNSYTQKLIKNLCHDNIRLLNGLSDFSLLRLDYNIWEKKIEPQMSKLSQYLESKFLLTGGNEK